MEKNKVYYQLTNNQKDVLLPYMMMPKNSGSVTSFGLYFTSKSGNIDVLEKTYNILLRDNDAFRLKLKLSMRGLRQYFEDYQYVKIPVIKIESEDKLLAEMTKYHRYKKFFSGGDLCNAFIFTYDNKATILVNIHHLVIDGLGLNIFTSSFLDVYNKIVDGTYVDETDNTRYTYEQFIQDNQPSVIAKKHSKDMKYYKDIFDNDNKLRVIGPIYWPTYLAASDSFTVDGEKYKLLIDYCDKINLSVSFFMSSMIMKTLCHVYKENYTCCSYLNNGRPKANQKKTIGSLAGGCIAFYHNDDSQSYKDYLYENYRNYLQSAKHGGLSISEYLRAAFKHTLKYKKCNYFNIMISCLNYWQNIDNNGDLKFGMLPTKYLSIPFYFTIMNLDDKICIDLTYQAKTISKEKLQAIKDDLSKCFEEVIKESQSLD